MKSSGGGQTGSALEEFVSYNFAFGYVSSRVEWVQICSIQLSLGKYSTQAKLNPHQMLSTGSRMCYNEQTRFVLVEYRCMLTCWQRRMGGVSFPSHEGWVTAWWEEGRSCRALFNKYTYKKSTLRSSNFLKFCTFNIFTSHTYSVRKRSRPWNISQIMLYLHVKYMW
jgi:hypothetical protein